MSNKSVSTIRAIVGGTMGNLVEWYDWYAYSAFALYFSAAFFPAGDATAQLLNTAAIFALGFLMRPIGGWWFGRMADRRGRKAAMTTSVLLMSFGSLLIALTPDYHHIGLAAPVVLVLARLLQGLSVGGEYGVSATYLSEMAGSRHRGFYSSFQYVTLIGGQLIALGLQLLLQQFFLSETQLQQWGWRIPFVLGAVLSVMALYLRSTLTETAAFEMAKKQSASTQGSITRLLQHPRALLTVVGLTMGGTLAFYTFTTYMQKFLVNTVHLSKQESTLLSFFSLLVFAGIQPLFGGWSDRIGRRPLLIGFGISGALLTYPLMTILSRANSLGIIFCLMLIALVVVSGYTSINAVVKAELFPAEIRALGVGLPYGITVALFGGTAEYIALWMKSIGHETWFYGYVSSCVAISLLVYLFMPETKTHSRIESD